MDGLKVPARPYPTEIEAFKPDVEWGHFGRGKGAQFKFPLEVPRNLNCVLKQKSARFP